MNWPGGSLPMIRRTSWPELAQRCRLQLGMLDDGAPERPRERERRSDLHPGGVYGSGTMDRLEGVHHVTLITGDAPRNVDFYTRVLGLRLVKKTVNQDDPTVYHLFYADEQASAGADITFFEYPGARRGRAGAGMVHTITWRVASEEALDFWEERLRGEAARSRRLDGRLRFEDPEGVRARARGRRDAGRRRSSPSIRRSRRSTRCRASTACARSRSTPSAAGRCSRGARLRAARREQWEARGEQRGGLYALRPAARRARHRRRRHRPPRRVGARRWTSTTPGGSARPRRGAADARDRPLLLPLDLLPRAERRAVRDRDARAGLRDRRGSRSTSASGSRCRRRSSTCASRSSRC